ncbi:MAG: ricin-type beta-trefoil lectin domain protein [Patescibacteria group bacterium]
MTQELRKTISRLLTLTLLIFSVLQNFLNVVALASSTNRNLNNSYDQQPVVAEQLEVESESPSKENLGNSNCANPVGWVEKTSAKEETSNVYFVPKSTDLDPESTPANNPENYNKVVCSYLQKVNYKEVSTGLFQEIDNNIRRIDKTDNVDIAKDYTYETGDNEFKGYFPKNPNLGWKYVNSLSNSTIKIQRVIFPDVELNPEPITVLESNSLVYQDILPGVDLKYVVDSEGISKYFVIKNQAGLENDLSKITFELAADKKLVQNKEQISKQIEVGESAPEAILAEEDGEILFEQPHTIDSKTLEAKPEKYLVSKGGKEINIFPDLEYLNSSDREFPILIDPKVVSAGTPTRDTFVRSNSRYTPQGTANRHMLSVGGKFFDPTTRIWLGQTRSFMQFSLPAEVNDANNIVGANFRLRQYATYNGGFRAKVYGVNGEFDEWKMTWNNQNGMAAEYGHVDFQRVNLNGNGNGKDIWSSDIRDLVRSSVTSRKVLIGLRDEDESKVRGVAFCAKDGNIFGHPCNSGDKGPVLQLYLNNRPTPPHAEAPVNRDENIGYCDLSNNTGNCSSVGRVDYRVSNVNDGDNNCNNSFVKLIQKDSTFWYNPWYDQTGKVKGCGTMTVSQDVQNGRYGWAAINRDNEGLESNHSNTQESFIIDTQPPFKTKSLEVPAYSKDYKVSFKAPEYIDNLLHRLRIYHQASGKAKSIDIDGSTYGGAYSNIQMYDSYSTHNQEFTYNPATKEIRTLFGKCLDDAAGNNGAQVYIYDCHSGNNQKWEFLESGEIKGLRSGRCLSHSNSVNNGTPITIWDCAQQENQLWSVQRIEPVRLRPLGQNFSINHDCNTVGCVLKSHHSGTHQELQSYQYTTTQQLKTINNLCVDGRFSREGDVVYLYSCHNGDNQKWILDTQNNLIKIKSNPNLCLSLSQGLRLNILLQLQKCNPDDSKQKLLLEPFHLFNHPNQQLTYLVQVSKNPEFTDLVNPEQTWTTTPKFDIGGLNNSNSEQTTYYVRMKARDRNNWGNISAWSETKTTILDTTLPEIKNINISNTRFSNNQIEGENIEFDFEYLEKNFSEAKVLVYSSDDQLVATLKKGERIDNNKMRFVWNGRDDLGKKVKSDGYIIQIIVSDLAGNTNDQNLANSKILLNLDNKPPKINISSPANNTWVNKDIINITGAVGVSSINPELFENDVEILEIAKVELEDKNAELDFQKIIFDKSVGNIFSTSQRLDLGLNQFKFRSKDDLGNSNTKIGLSNIQDVWSINYENTSPKIIELDSKDIVNGGTNKSIFVVDFAVQDVKNDDKNQVSGLQLDYNGINTNLGGFDISLTHSSNNGEKWSEIALYKDGFNLTDTNSEIRLANDLKCKALGSDPYSQVNCQLELQNLQPDGLYRLYLRLSDKAGNTACSYEYTEIDSSLGCEDKDYQGNPLEFEVKTSTHLSLDEPLDTQNLAKGTLTFSGTIEKDNTLIISNNLLDRVVKVNANQTKKVLPSEYRDSNSELIAAEVDLLGREFSIATQPAHIVCKGETIDHDNDTVTKDLEVCSFKIVLNQQDNQSDTNITPGVNVQKNINKVISQDSIGNQIEQTKIANVDLYGINLSSQPSIQIFSPNGDDRFDQITFSNRATKIVTGDDYTEDIRSYSASIYDSAGELVWQKTSPKNTKDRLNSQGLLTYKVPSTIYFDGKNNQFNKSGQWLKDGIYNYRFSITTKSNTVFSTPSQTIIAKSDLASEAIIFTPRDNYTTSRSLLNVQGQAPKNWEVEICLLNSKGINDQKCDYTQSAKVNENGFFSTIVSLPYDGDRFELSVIAKDKYGNQTQGSNKVTVNLDKSELLKNVSLSGNLGGINTIEVLKKFEAGDLTIDELKHLQIETIVQENTDSLELDFVDYTNLSELPNTNPKTGLVENNQPINYNKIATINNTVERSASKNPNNSSSIKKDLSQHLGVNQSARDLPSDYVKPCDKQECKWVYSYPLPKNLSGGIYEIRIRARRGDSVEEFTESFVVNTSLPATPAILTVDKKDKQKTVYNSLNRVGNSFYTNSPKIKIRGVSDIDSAIELKLRNEKQTEILSSIVQVNSDGFWSHEFDLPDIEGGYQILIIAKKNQLQSQLSEYKVILDKTLPKLQWVETQTASNYNGFALNPWVNSSPVSFKIKSTEALGQANLFDPSGKTMYKANKEIPDECLINSRDIQGKDIQSGSAIISALCRQNYLLSSQMNTTLVPQNKNEEGIYTPIIHLEDLAGNRVFYSNDQQRLDKLSDSLSSLNKNHSFLNDPKVLVQVLDEEGKYLPKIQKGDQILGTQALPKDYPYSQLPRAKSLDFRLFFDITPTVRTDFDLPSLTKRGDFGDKIDGILADGVAAEADRILTDQSWFDTKNVCQQNSADYCTPKPTYTIRGNKIYLKGWVEKNQRIILSGQQKNSLDQDFAVPFVLAPKVDYQNCRSQRRVRKNLEKNGLVVKFKDLCYFEAVFDLINPDGSPRDDGLSKNGVPNNYYTFSFYPIDLAGNVALPVSDNHSSTSSVVQIMDSLEVVETTVNTKLTDENDRQYTSHKLSTSVSKEQLVNIGSSTITVYHDSDAPENTRILNMSSKKQSPLIDFISNPESSKVAITNNPKIKVIVGAEQQADIDLGINKKVHTTKGGFAGSDLKQHSFKEEIEILDDDNQYIKTKKTKLLRNGKADNPSVKSELVLGSDSRDDFKDNCVFMSHTPTKNRRLGNCNDGLYNVRARAIDTAGNRSEFVESKVERDTVSPAVPDLKVNKIADSRGAVLGEYLGVDIVGEAGAKAFITIQDQYSNKQTKNARLDSNGKFSSSNLIGKLHCGGSIYKVKVRVMDRAENVSDFTTIISIKTEECPTCSSTGSSEMKMPVRSPVAHVSSEFGIYEPWRKGPHAGIDFSASANTPVYASKAGKVVRVVMGYSNYSYGMGWANNVIIEHYDNNGKAYLQTVYAHLQNQQLVSVGQFVDTNTIIGRVGNSGTSTGYHLHFQIERRGVKPHKAFAGRFNRWGPVNPREYLGDMSGNLNQAQKEGYCAQSNQGGSVGYYNGYGDVEITESEAEHAIADYLNFSLGDRTQLESDNNSNVYITKRDYIKLYNHNWDQIRANLNLDKVCEGVWYKPLGRIYEDGIVSSGYDGAIVVNNYDKKAYLIKNAIFEKWINEQGCMVVGVPRDSEQSFKYNSLFTNAYYQRYQLHNFTQNSIYHHRGNGSYFVNGVVANKYESLGGAGSIYGTPTEDTQSDPTEEPYCKQRFQFNLEINLCTDIEAVMRIRQSTLVSKYINTRLLLYYTPNGLKHYDSSDSNVWIISHGMNENINGFIGVAKAIVTERPNDFVFLLDWQDGSDENLISVDGNYTPNPHKTDEWIAPTARAVFEKLTKWGVNDPSKINLVGNSMGTFMSAEIGKLYNRKFDNKPVKSVYLLDPPSYITGFRAEFQVDDSKYSKDTLYNKNNGYSSHVKAEVLRSFVGQNRHGKDGLCGNSPLAKTAKETYIVIFDDIFSDTAEFCPAHNSVRHVFEQIISDKKTDKYLSLDDRDQNKFHKSSFYEHNSNVDGMILTYGKKNTTSIQNLTVQNGSDRNSFVQYGTSTDNDFRDFNEFSINFEKPTTIKNFGNNGNIDKISLATAEKPEGYNPSIVNNYRYINNNGEIKIQRFIKLKGSLLVDWHDAMKIDGDKRNDINQEQLRKAIFGSQEEKEKSLIKFR